MINSWTLSLLLKHSPGILTSVPRVILITYDIRVNIPVWKFCGRAPKMTMVYSVAQGTYYLLINLVTLQPVGRCSKDSYTQGTYILLTSTAMKKIVSTLGRQVPHQCKSHGPLARTPNPLDLYLEPPSNQGCIVQIPVKKLRAYTRGPKQTHQTAINKNTLNILP